MKSAKTNQFIAASLTLIASFGTTACTDEEILAAVGGAAIVGGAVAIGVACANSDDCDTTVIVDDRYDSCRGGYREVCHDFRDYRGHFHRECRSEYDSCAYRSGRRHSADIAESIDGMSAADMSAAAASTDDMGIDDASRIGTITSKPRLIVKKKSNEDTVTATNWAKAFDMSYEQSERMVSALKSARNGKTTELASLGLARADMKALAAYSLPSDAGIDALAESLNQDSNATRTMLEQIIKSAKDAKN